MADHASKRLDDCTVLVGVVLIVAQGFALFDQDVEYLKRANLGLDLLRVVSQIVENAHQVWQQEISPEGLSRQVDEIIGLLCDHLPPVAQLSQEANNHFLNIVEEALRQRAEQELNQVQ